MDEDIASVQVAPQPGQLLSAWASAQAWSGPGLGDLAQLAAELAGTQMAYIVIRDGGGLHVVASYGMPPSLVDALTASAVLDDAAYCPSHQLLPDLQSESRYRTDPIVSQLRGHASLPLKGIDGALCVTGPGNLPSHDGIAWPALQTVARRVVAELLAESRAAELSATIERLQSSEATLRATNEQLGMDYRGLLDNMADGVLSIGPEQQIEVLNPVGSTILGVAAEAVVGRTLIEAFLSESDNDALVDAVLLPLVEQVSSTRSTVDYQRGTEIRQLSVASATYQLRFGPQRGKIGVITAFSDVTEVNALRLAEQALKRRLEEEHAKLQAAYVTLEHSAVREKAVTRRAQVIGFSAVAAVFVAIAAVGAYTWLPGSGLFAGSTAAASTAAGTMTVAAQPITSQIAVVGTIDAGSVVSVVGPYDGSISGIFFRYGGAVDRGKPLLKLETADLEVSLRDAQGAEIRASQKVAELRDWANSPDMSRARRTISSGELDLTSLRSKATQTKMLLGKGIVAADEYTQLLQQIRGQEMQLQAARQDLQATADRASDENRRLADFDLTNAHAKVAILRNDLSHAEVLAPVSGVALQPPDDSNKPASLVTVGTRVSKGQTMFAIGDLETMSVRAKVDEIDVNKVRVGQSVVITSDALEDVTLNGTVASVAAQASGESTIRSGMAAFPITVLIAQLTPDQRARIHVGMSANLSIIAYDKPDAIVIPVSALQTTDAGRTVRLHRGGQTETVPVTLGISTPTGVEIRRGLKPGDVIETP